MRVLPYRSQREQEQHSLLSTTLSASPHTHHASTHTRHTPHSFLMACYPAQEQEQHSLLSVLRKLTRPQKRELLSQVMGCRMGPCQVTDKQEGDPAR